MIKLGQKGNCDNICTSIFINGKQTSTIAYTAAWIKLINLLELNKC
jgi:hypothetical protein